MYGMTKSMMKAKKPVFKMVGDKFPETNLVKGAGKITEVARLLKNRSANKALIVTDAVLFDLGLLNPMIEQIEAEGIEYFMYKDVKPDPTFDIVKAAMKICQDNDCQAVVAFGGGSVLDTAKTVAATAANGFVDPTKLEGMMKVRKQPLPFIAIPTTAGTGSEVTTVAVVSDPVSHRKTTIIDPKLIATDTILDPTITTGLPPYITSSTGIDALTHAVEAFVSGFANDKTDDWALNAIKLLDENLFVAYNEPTNIEARENLLYGSTLAGHAFTRAFVGYVHAFAHNIGGKYGVPHGLANAVLLPHVMEDARPEASDRFAIISDLLNLVDKSSSVDEKTDAFIKYLFDLNKKLGIPERLEVYPEDGIDAIIEGAFKEAHGIYPVPHYYSKEEAKTLLLKVCNKA